MMMANFWGLIILFSIMGAAAAEGIQDLGVFVGVMLGCLALGGIAFYKFLKSDQGQNRG
jgi:hypothetical protein